MQIGDILAQIDKGAMALPTFQRGYVWDRDQVRELMVSLYRRYPIGSMLTWRPDTSVPLHGASIDQIELILDGQQRITSLYGLIRGQPPQFFQGNRYPFINLYFNIETETFAFFSADKAQNNPLWADVTTLMQRGVGPHMRRLIAKGIDPAEIKRYIDRLNAVLTIQAIDLHIERLEGPDKTLSVVLEIFTRLNSAGTTFSKGNLALAQLYTRWPVARQEIHNIIQRWAVTGLSFTTEWLLHIVAALLTGKVHLAALADVDASTFKTGLRQAEMLCDCLLTTLATRLGLDHDRALSGRAAFPVLCRYLALHEDALEDARTRDRLLYWYIHAFLWGRHTPVSEIFLNQDLRLLERGDTALSALIEQLRLLRPDLRVRPDDFDQATTGSRFYALLAILTHTSGTRDWITGKQIARLEDRTTLRVHHIFPTALLYQHGYSRNEANALANFCFLTQAPDPIDNTTSLVDLLDATEQAHPGTLVSQWIPLNRELWSVENYHRFLDERRMLLAQAANSFLDSLFDGTAAEQSNLLPDHRPALAIPIPDLAENEPEDLAIQECNDWIARQGLLRGEYMYELTDPTSGEPLTIIDLAWPHGLQGGNTTPVALLIAQPAQALELVRQSGYRCFTDIELLRTYIERTILILSHVI